jgi:acetoin utilization deacetylase AcuC-like enzyme
MHDPSQLLVNGAPFIYEEQPRRADILLACIEVARLGPISPARDHGMQPIQEVHSADFLAFLQEAYARQEHWKQDSGPVFPETFPIRPARHRTTHPVGRAGYYSFGTGSPILPGTWQAAYWSAQVAITAADRLLGSDELGKAEPNAYALCRPPGHHAGADIYGGFCYLNNAAIAARYLQQRWGAVMPHHIPANKQRIAILDIDYHHGNGTQEIFYRDPSVLYCSLHAHPDDDYPYFWVGADESGEDEGLGTNFNWPLKQGSTDGEYLQTLEKALGGVQHFLPCCLVVSLGLDIAAGDSVGGFCITTEGFEQIGKRIAALQLPTLIVQEGGYLLETLGQNAVAFLQPFAQQERLLL